MIKLKNTVNQRNAMICIVLAFLVSAPRVCHSKENKVSESQGNAIVNSKVNSNTSDTDSNSIVDQIDGHKPFPYQPLCSQSFVKGQCDLRTTPALTYSVQAYFAPTCGHCSQFFQDMKASDFLKNYVDTGIIKFYMRPFIMHPQDRAVVRICASEGESNFIFYFRQFMEDHSWFAPSISEKKGKEKQDELNAYQSKLLSQMNSDRKQFFTTSLTLLDPSLKIEAKNDLSAIILFALSIGVKASSINAVLARTADIDNDALSHAFVLAQLEAQDEKMQPVDAVPVFYLNGILHKDGMTVETLTQLITSGVKNKEFPAQMTMLPQKNS